MNYWLLKRTSERSFQQKRSSFTMWTSGLPRSKMAGRADVSQRRLRFPSFSLAGFCLLFSCAQAQSTTKAIPQQRFALEPTDRTAVVGSKVLLPCRVEHRRGTLQWTRDGFGLGSDRTLSGFPRYVMMGSDEEENYSLQIENVSLEDDALFQCQVGAVESVKGIRSRTAQLTVYVPPEPPRIVQGDFLQTTAGITVELTCESHQGKPAAELTWLDGEGSEVPSGSGLETTQTKLADGKRANSALKWTFIPGRQHDSKTFTCRAENPALTQPLYAHIKLEVKYPPEITLKINSDKIMELEDAIFTCSALANPSDLVYKWYKNDEILPGDHTTSLEIRKVPREFNKNTISCEVGNSVGTTRSTHVLNVHYGPVIRSPSESLAVDLGQRVKLLCDVDGNPKPDIVWTFENSAKVLSVNTEFVIKEMTPDQAGKYTCKATVPGFKEAVIETTVFIKGPPRIVSPPTQYGLEGEEVIVECLIHSVPAPTSIVWTKNSKRMELDNNEGYHFKRKEIANGVRYQLVILKAGDGDFGSYNCSVWNPFGHHSVLIALQKQKSLPMLIILAGVIGGIVFVVSVTIVIILCLRRKSGGKDEYTSEKKTKQCDSASSGDSDLKVEIRTASSLSNTEHERSWEDNSDTTRTIQDAQDIYKYAVDFAEPAFPPKPETQNNNGYIPYVDYSRDYNPPSMHGLHGPPVTVDGSYDGLPQSLSELNPGGASVVDPRYSAGYANPYLRTSQSSLPPPQGVYISPRGSINSAASSTAALAGHNRYITAQASHLKPGTLATHV